MKIDKSKTVAIKGHMNDSCLLTNREVLSEEIETIILKYYSQGYTYFMSGMAIGFDLLAAEAVIRLQPLYSGLKLIAAIPFPEHSKHYNDEDKRRYENILQQCEATILVNLEKHWGSYQRGVDFLIDQSSCIIAYFDGIRRGSTEYTVEHAKLRRMPLSNVFDSAQATLWWETLSVECKSLFSGIDSERASAYHYRRFWKQVESGNRVLLFTYWKYRTGMIQLSEEVAHSLQMEIISELCELKLEFEFGLPSSEMYNDEGQYFDNYQDRFNDLYDDLEERLMEYQF